MLLGPTPLISTKLTNALNGLVVLSACHKKSSVGMSSLASEEDHGDQRLEKQGPPKPHHCQSNPELYAEFKSILDFLGIYRDPDCRSMMAYSAGWCVIPNANAQRNVYLYHTTLRQ